MTTYVLVPGYVISKRDYDKHYINAKQLQRLYRVNPANCIEAPTGLRARGWKPPADAVFLYPRSDGDYSLPTTTTTEDN